PTPTRRTAPVRMPPSSRSTTDIRSIPDCCFASPHYLRVPPSFPTRRSSDLRHQHDRVRVPAEALPVRAGREQCGDRRNQQRIPEDRKSTRLNSSHVKISYAVFCLKKKQRQKSNLAQQRGVIASIAQDGHRPA